jgi:N-acyl homoserine lactone hydrolase
MRAGGYEIDIVVQGYPGKSVCHGGLGWSTVALLRGQGRVALVDVGSFAYRPFLEQRLAERGVSIADVTDVILTHAHHDHSINWVLFRDARIHMGSGEMDWALARPWGVTPVAELYMERLATWPSFHRLAPGDEVIPGMRAHAGPGHTPGSLLFVLEGERHDVIFVGDAAKNRAELVSLTTDMTYDMAVSRGTLALIWELWRKRPSSVVVPGHDLPMTQVDGVTSYLGAREAGVVAWYGDTMETMTRYTLTP